MKILQVLPDLRAGGVEVEAVIIAKGIRDHGHQSMIAAASNVMLHGEPGITFVAMDLKSKNPLTLIANGIRLAKFARRENVDLFHVRSRAPAWSVRLASRLSGIPYICTWHSTFGIDALGVKKLYNGVMTKGRLVISISGFITRHILENYNVDPARIVQINRGIDLALFNPDYRPAKTRTSLGLPEDAFIIGSLGRISSTWKGFDVLVGALPHLPMDMHLAIAGSDPKDKRQNLESLAKRLGVHGRLHFLPHLSSAQDFIALCDAGASGAIKGEAFGRTAVEFQAMGKPFFGSDLGAFRENVFYGSLFPVGNARAMADALLAFLATSPAPGSTEAALRKQAAHHHARDEFNQSAMIERTIAVYSQVLDEHSAGRIP